MKEQLNAIYEKAIESIKNAEQMKDIDELKVKILGKKGELTGILKGMGKLAPEERPVIGELANKIRADIENKIDETKKEFAAKEQQKKLNEETIDVTMPGKKCECGHKHPMSIVIDEISDIFIGMGYEIVEGPEVELDYYNFEALNIPANHPAKDEQDTFYINGGIVIDKGITMGDLKGALEVFAKELFGKDIKVRFRPHHFPFTEPSAEMDVTCFACGGKGCRVCKGEGYIELLGCGMVHPKVLKMSGIDPEVYSGFAFGMGLERVAMQRYGITDLRLLFENDTKFLKQF